MKLKITLRWALRLIILTILYFPIWILGSLAMGSLVPEVPSETGLLREEIGLVVLGLINTFLIIGLIVSSRWSGWRLVFFLALAYYGAFTLITQVETWYFLTDLTVSPKLLPRLFIMGLSIPVIYMPLAILICGKWKKRDDTIQNVNLNMPINQFLFKLTILAFIYLIIYWFAGYFIAWQNPDLRQFYGNSREIETFLAHTFSTFNKTPGLILLQIGRGILYAIIVMPIILGSKVKPWFTGFLIGFLFAVPHLVHILPNPLIPIASVRFSHMIETATSTFIFGLITVWLLHSRHRNVKDLFS
jgi:hypothetical protein